MEKTYHFFLYISIITHLIYGMEPEKLDTATITHTDQPISDAENGNTVQNPLAINLIKQNSEQIAMLFSPRSQPSQDLIASSPLMYLAKEAWKEAYEKIASGEEMHNLEKVINITNLLLLLQESSLRQFTRASKELIRYYNQTNLLPKSMNGFEENIDAKPLNLPQPLTTMLGLVNTTDNFLSSMEKKQKKTILRILLLLNTFVYEKKTCLNKTLYEAMKTFVDTTGNSEHDGRQLLIETNKLIKFSHNDNANDLMEKNMDIFFIRVNPFFQELNNYLIKTNLISAFVPEKDLEKTVLPTEKPQSDAQKIYGFLNQKQIRILKKSLLLVVFGILSYRILKNRYHINFDSIFHLFS
ncbi:hypothetical protein IPH25_03960 [bacterium]|nr:MAG: hypothetical protein IPG37_00955 [bacterium]QQR61604.1 MAG: hypothetical protein IPH25_03960 [bacterium]QQR62836.1 MAG: hypothetical protein IPH67_05535 [bacterium]